MDQALLANNGLEMLYILSSELHWDCGECVLCSWGAPVPYLFEVLIAHIARELVDCIGYFFGCIGATSAHDRHTFNSSLLGHRLNGCEGNSAGDGS